MKSLVYIGHITQVDKDTFVAEVSRKEETLVVEFDKSEVETSEQDFIQEGIGLRWYVTEKGCAIRLILTRIKPSDIKKADMLAREWQDVFNMDTEK